MNIKGTFEVKMSAEPPFDTADGVTLGRASFDKQFFGPLTATSKVQMLAARTPIADSAGYVAIERITGAIDGKNGSFVAVHMGLADRGKRTLKIHVVPDSGTGELVGMSGTMSIEITDGKHIYELDYTLPSA